MTYEEIMSIGAGDVVPGGYSVAVNATYIGPGEAILDANGSVAPGGHSVSKWDPIVVLDISYGTQLALIQYQAGNQVRQGYIHNGLSNIEYKNLEQNFWKNGSTPETVYYSYTGNSSYKTPIPARDKAIFLYQVEKRYNVAYTTNKGNYTCAGFVDYAGGITPQITNGRRVAGKKSPGGDFWLNNIAPGEVVPGGRSFPVNATAQVDLDVRDSKGNSIPGREVSKNDPLTVLDVSESKQLALVQYPSSGQIRQGYVTNNSRYITYNNPESWYNGDSAEEVINYDGSHLGWLSPHETATILYRTNGLTQVVYNTDLGVNTKSGFVRYAGGTRDIVYKDIPNPNVTNAQVIQYGTSGKGRALKAYKMGNGRNSFIFNCEIHGWEDHWPADGIELTKIGNQIIEHFQNNSTGDFTLYVIPAANPDGVSQGWTNDGPGRCSIVGGVDCNRDFPIGFTSGGAPRNYTGAQPLSVPESRDLANFISGVKNRTNGETFLIDMHGWEGSMVGDSRIGRHFTGKLGLVQKGFGNPRGFLVQWTNSIGIVSSIMELPTTIYSHAAVVNLNCAGKIIEGLTEIMGTTGGGSTSGDYNGHIKSGIQYVNIRTVPTTSNNTPIGKLYGDNPIQILAKVKPYGDSYYWYKIVFIKNGERLQAYVREDFVTVTGEIPKDDIPSGGGEPSELLDFSVGQVNEKASSVHVRKGPSTATDIVTSVSSGELLNVIGKTQPGGETIPWYEIKINGQEVYIRSDFVNKVSETKLNEDGHIESSIGWVRVRSLPGTGSEATEITKLNSGAWVEIFEKLQPKGETIPWYRIRWQAGVGFVRSDFINIETTNISTTTTPDEMFKKITLNINGYDINYHWSFFKGEYHMLADMDKDNLENLHHAYAISFTPESIISILVSLTPLDAAKDIIDFVCGKDIITGESVDRRLQFMCILVPAVGEGLLKRGFKNSHEILSFFRKAGALVKTGNSIVDAKAINKKALTEYASTMPKLKEEGKLNGSNGQTLPQKISRAMDLTNYSKFSIGFSGIEKYNPTIGKLNLESDESFSSNVKKAYINQSKRLLTKEYLDNELKNSDNEIRKEYEKFIKMVQNALEKGKKESRNKYPSEEAWDVENCAEIWAVRKAILNGSKINNLIIRTLQVPQGAWFLKIKASEWKYVGPCANCKNTFEGYLEALSE